MAKLPATLEGVLEQFQLCFIDLEKQEKRALSFLKKREEEMNQKLQEQEEISGMTPLRSLKEIETIDRLQHESLKIINDNNKIKVDLAKFYANTVLNNKIEEKMPTEYETNSEKTPLSALDFEALRRAVNGEIK